MNLNDMIEKVKPWVKPALIGLLGIILFFRPTSIAAALAGVVGYLIALLGAGLLISFFFGSNKAYYKLIAAVILLPLGYSVIRDPMSLVNRLAQIVGVLVLLQSLRTYFEQGTLHSKPFSIVSCVVGVVLLLMPGTVSRLVFFLCGVVLLAIAAGMVMDVKKYGTSSTGGDDEIIDAR